MVGGQGSKWGKGHNLLDCNCQLKSNVSDSIEKIILTSPYYCSNTTGVVSLCRETKFHVGVAIPSPNNLVFS